MEMRELRAKHHEARTTTESVTNRTMLSKRICETTVGKLSGRTVRMLCLGCVARQSHHGHGFLDDRAVVSIL